MSPLTVLAVTSPDTSVRVTSSFTVLTSTRPFASWSATAPWTEVREMYPVPPRHLISPRTVSAVTPAWVPSTSMSVLMPERFNTIHAGALMV